MARNFQYVKAEDGLSDSTEQFNVIEEDGTVRSVPNDLGNKDYVEYLKFVSDGNTPLASD